jgi:RimJ/RimL family protein N-acetyltransferase
LHPIQTPRLQIRPYTPADLNDVARLHDECFGPAARQTRRHWLDWTVRNYAALAQLRQPPYGDYAVTAKDNGQLVGAVGLVPTLAPFDKLPILRSRLSAPPTNLYTPEVGLFWATAPAHRRQGYANEAAAALAHFAFEHLQVQRLVATTEHSNTASIAVMRRLGMTIDQNPDPDPQWFQAVGVLFHPSLR